MYNHTNCNKEVVEDSLRRIDFYIPKKENNIFDYFYMSHLNCFMSLIEDWKSEEENCFAIIYIKDGHVYDSGEVSPTYATICKSPHWGKQEGVMLTSGLYDATKFDLFSEDLPYFLSYIKKRYPDKNVSIAKIPKDICGSNPRELWSNAEIRGDFDTTGLLNGNIIKDI